MLKIVKFRRTSTFKLLFLALSLAMFAVTLVGSAPQPTLAQTDRTPALSVVGNLIKDPGGNTVILRGISLIDPGAMNLRDRARNTEAMMDMAVGWYARVIRIPVYPDPGSTGSPAWNPNPDAYYNNHLKPALDHCISLDVYCIIDWHYISDYNSTAVDTATKAFWNYIAPLYKNNNNIIFELFNEPIYPNNWATWKTWAQPWVDIIRSHAPSNLILIGGPSWSQTLSDADTSPFTGSNLVYVAHIYPCHGTGPCNGTTYPNRQAAWDAWFGHVATTRPFLITEWGYQADGAIPTGGTGATTSVFGTEFLAYLDAKGVSWTAWDFDHSWEPKMFNSDYSIAGGENYMGQFAKDALYARRNSNLPNAATWPVIPNGVKVQISKGNTSPQDDTSGTKFQALVYNSGPNPVSNISFRVYYTADGTNTCGSYNLNSYYDTTPGSVTIGAATAAGAHCYRTVSLGTDTLASGPTWLVELLMTASGNNSANDWYHTGYAVGALPGPAFKGHPYLPAYVSGVLSWGVEPGGGTVPTNTPSVPTNTPTRTNTPSVPTNTPTRTNTPAGPTATRTNTPAGPTATRTNTPVPPPTNTPGGGTSTLKVQYKAGNTAASTQQVAPHFRIVNTGSTAVALSTLKIRYYFSRETTATLPLTTYCDYSFTAGGCAQVTHTSAAYSPVVTGADYYIEVGFTTSAGSVAAGGNTGETQIRFSAANWATFTQTGDYSFDATKSSFADWNKVVLLQNGTVVWGTLP